MRQKANRWLASLCCIGLVAGAATSSQAANDAPAARRGQNWDSIKSLPDWSGVWAPGSGPPGVAAPAGPFGSAAMPLKPELQARLRARMGAVRGDQGAEAIPLSNSGLCLPNGTPWNMSPVAHEYLYSPGRVTILLENSEIRRIYTDGRTHVPPDIANPSFSGDSIGHWEGDTLVIDTVNIFPEAEFFIGMRVTEKTRVQERITRQADFIRIDTVVTEPLMFTQPWAYTRWYARESGPPIEYESCTSADRAHKADGRLLDIDFNTVPKEAAP